MEFQSPRKQGMAIHDKQEKKPLSFLYPKLMEDDHEGNVKTWQDDKIESF